LDWFLNDGAITPPKTKLLGYGGAAGGGKTDAFLALALIVCYAFPGAKVSFFRRKYTELEGPDGAIQRSQAIFASLPGASYNDQKHRWQFDNGSYIFFRHCQHEKNVHDYQSQQFNVLLIDEATHFTWLIVDYLITRNRCPNIHGLTPFTVMASNPGGIGHGWYSQLYDLQDHTGGEEGPHERIKHRLSDNNKYEDIYFVPARLEDNQVLMLNDPDYERKLSNREGDLAAALRWGDWRTFAGQVFKSFSRSTHVVEPFELPKSWPRWRAVDWGKAKPFCCLWFAKDLDIGRIYVYRELYKTDLTDQQQARMIAEMTMPDETVLYTMADPSMWEEKSYDGQVFTTANQYAKNQVPLVKANNDRLGGKRKVDRVLSMLPDGKPGLIIYSTCTNLLRTLPVLPYDPIMVEDVDSEAEDHAYDALRYGLTNYRMEGEQQKERKENPLARYDRRF